MKDNNLNYREDNKAGQYTTVICINILNNSYFKKPLINAFLNFCALSIYFICFE